MATNVRGSSVRAGPLLKNAKGELDKESERRNHLG